MKRLPSLNTDTQLRLLMLASISAAGMIVCGALWIDDAQLNAGTEQTHRLLVWTTLMMIAPLSVAIGLALHRRLQKIGDPSPSGGVPNDELESAIERQLEELAQAGFHVVHDDWSKSNFESAPPVRPVPADPQQQRLMDSARRAGMAEVATGVLHNVGNVLNSINVSATLATDLVRQSKVTDLVRAATLLERHRFNLASFLENDSQGRQLPDFLRILAAHLVDERNKLLNELESLTSKVNHVKTIVATQQSYAEVSLVIEAVDLEAVLDDALALNASTLKQQRIRVVKDCAVLPVVLLDKHRVLQVLVNLINNAHDAIVEQGEADGRVLTVKTTLWGQQRLRIEVSDTGVGIDPALTAHIFSQGFTTKRHGHGFGLHSCAIAARELGGSLSVVSPGRGRGATFTLELPFEPAEACV